MIATTSTIVPANTSISFPADHYNHVDPEPVPTTTTTTVTPALLPTTTNIPVNCRTIFATAPESTINTTFPSNPPNHVVPEPDTTITTHVYANTYTQNSAVPDPTPPPQNPPIPDPTTHPTHVEPVPDTPSLTTINPAVDDYCHGL